MTLEGLARGCLAGAISMGLAAALSGAAAVPLGKAPAAPQRAAVEAPVELVHGCHRGIQRDYSGWHFHNRACVRVPTAPPGLYDVPAYRRYYRGPVCSYRCGFVGPVKTCSQVCR